METRSQQELITLAVVSAFAAFVFWQTRGFAMSSGGQISPGAFPRMAAGTMMGMAAIRAFLLIRRSVRPAHAGLGPWSWHVLKRPVAAAALMVGYTLAFAHVPFTPLTLAFILAAFVVFGVRPWPRLAVATVVSSVFLYLLFVQLLNVGV